MSKDNVLRLPLLLVLSVIGLTGCSTTSKLGAAASIAKSYASSGPSTGYDWAQVLPPVPIADSVDYLADLQTVRGYQNLQGTQRWLQATDDASLDMYGAYRAVLGPDFTLAKRPEIAALWAYAGRQFSVASTESKTAFPRPRPFLADPTIKMCVDQPPGGSSFPSGHSGWGWLSAQILARVEPERAGAILARGRDYGDSRVICGVHYPSDVQAGRLLGDAVLTRLDNDAQYQRLLAIAKGAVK